jgi:uncharacterized membrane protein
MIEVEVCIFFNRGIRMKRRLVFLLCVIGLVALLSGCVKGDFHITVNKNGSADLDYKIGMMAQLVGLISGSGNGKQDPIAGMKVSFENVGFAVSQYRDGDYIGVSAKKHVDNLKDIGNSLPNENMLNESQKSQVSDKLNFTEDKGLFFTTYRYTGSIDFTNMKPDDKDTMGIQQMMLKQVDLKLTLTLPVQADAQNASRVLPDQKTYQWDLIPGTKGDIMLQAKVPNVTNIIISILLLIVIVAAVIVFIVKSRRKRKLQDIQIAEPPLSIE